MGMTSSPNKSSSMLGKAPPNGSMWSSSIMGILEAVIRSYNIQISVKPPGA